MLNSSPNQVKPSFEQVKKDLDTFSSKMKKTFISDKFNSAFRHYGVVNPQLINENDIEKIHSLIQTDYDFLKNPEHPKWADLSGNYSSTVIANLKQLVIIYKKNTTKNMIFNEVVYSSNEELLYNANIDWLFSFIKQNGFILEDKNNKDYKAKWKEITNRYSEEIALALKPLIDIFGKDIPKDRLTPEKLGQPLKEALRKNFIKYAEDYEKYNDPEYIESILEKITYFLLVNSGQNLQGDGWVETLGVNTLASAGYDLVSGIGNTFGKIGNYFSPSKAEKKKEVLTEEQISTKQIYGLLATYIKNLDGKFTLARGLYSFGYVKDKNDFVKNLIESKEGRAVIGQLEILLRELLKTNKDNLKESIPLILKHYGILDNIVNLPTDPEKLKAFDLEALARFKKSTEQLIIEVINKEKLLTGKTLPRVLEILNDLKSVKSLNGRQIIHLKNNIQTLLGEFKAEGLRNELGKVIVDYLNIENKEIVKDFSLDKDNNIFDILDFTQAFPELIEAALHSHAIRNIIDATLNNKTFEVDEEDKKFIADEVNKLNIEEKDKKTLIEKINDKPNFEEVQKFLIGEFERLGIKEDIINKIITDLNKKKTEKFMTNELNRFGSELELKGGEDGLLNYKLDLALNTLLKENNRPLFLKLINGTLKFISKPIEKQQEEAAQNNNVNVDKVEDKEDNEKKIEKDKAENKFTKAIINKILSSFANKGENAEYARNIIETLKVYLSNDECKNTLKDTLPVIFANNQILDLFKQEMESEKKGLEIVVDEEEAQKIEEHKAHNFARNAKIEHFKIKAEELIIKLVDSGKLVALIENKVLDEETFAVLKDIMQNSPNIKEFDANKSKNFISKLLAILNVINDKELNSLFTETIIAYLSVENSNLVTDFNLNKNLSILFKLIQSNPVLLELVLSSKAIRNIIDDSLITKKKAETEDEKKKQKDEAVKFMQTQLELLATEILKNPKFIDSFDRSLKALFNEDNNKLLTSELIIGSIKMAVESLKAEPEAKEENKPKEVINPNKPDIAKAFASKLLVELQRNEFIPQGYAFKMFATIKESVVTYLNENKNSLKESLPKILENLKVLEMVEKPKENASGKEIAKYFEKIQRQTIFKEDATNLILMLVEKDIISKLFSKNSQALDNDTIALLLKMVSEGFDYKKLKANDILVLKNVAIEILKSTDDVEVKEALVKTVISYINIDDSLLDIITVTNKNKNKVVEFKERLKDLISIIINGDTLNQLIDSNILDENLATIAIQFMNGKFQLSEEFPNEVIETKIKQLLEFLTKKVNGPETQENSIIQDEFINTVISYLNIENNDLVKDFKLKKNLYGLVNYSAEILPGLVNIALASSAIRDIINNSLKNPSVKPKNEAEAKKQKDKANADILKQLKTLNDEFSGTQNDKVIKVFDEALNNIFNSKNIDKNQELLNLGLNYVRKMMAEPKVTNDQAKQLTEAEKAINNSYTKLGMTIAARFFEKLGNGGDNYARNLINLIKNNPEAKKQVTSILGSSLTGLGIPKFVYNDITPILEFASKPRNARALKGLIDSLNRESSFTQKLAMGFNALNIATHAAFDFSFISFIFNVIISFIGLIITSVYEFVIGRSTLGENLSEALKTSVSSKELALANAPIAASVTSQEDVGSLIRDTDAYKKSSRLSPTGSRLRNLDFRGVTIDFEINDKSFVGFNFSDSTIDFSKMNNVTFVNTKFDRANIKFAEFNKEQVVSKIIKAITENKIKFDKTSFDSLTQACKTLSNKTRQKDSKRAEIEQNASIGPLSHSGKGQ
ncbi:MAG: hypothetical protein J0H68_03510 [Sphingobacteriia bacterium]|nr:hypothetical protein [Sphingobacteriia bacterium]